MEKTRELFDIWNENKKKDGKFKRVCLILHNNLGNWLLLVAPITTKYHKRMEKYYIKIDRYEKYGLKECRIIINQIKLIDTKRLFSKPNNKRPLLWLAIKVRHFYWNIIQK